VQSLRKAPLTVAETLAWADSHRARTGRWPSCTDTQVHGAPGETWVNVNQALLKGLRGLPGGDALPGCWPASAAGGTSTTSRGSPRSRSPPGRWPTAPVPAAGPMKTC
jgi:hypothetical protein